MKLNKQDLYLLQTALRNLLPSTAALVNSLDGVKFELELRRILDLLDLIETHLNEGN